MVIVLLMLFAFCLRLGRRRFVRWPTPSLALCVVELFYLLYLLFFLILGVIMIMFIIFDVIGMICVYCVFVVIIEFDKVDGVECVSVELYNGGIFYVMLFFDEELS